MSASILSSFLLCAVSALPAQEPVQAQDLSALTESNLGLTIFEPQYAEAYTLIDAATQLTYPEVTYYVRDPRTNEYQVRRRDRFVEIEGVIGVQDFTEDRRRATELLTRLDEQIGALRTKRAGASEAEALTRTVRPRTLTLEASVDLIMNMGFAVETHLVPSIGAVVLRGPVPDVARAESLILELDQPAPQFLLHCRLVKSLDVTQPLDDESGTPLEGELADGLADLLPGKRFLEAGRFFLRCSADRNSMLGIEGSVPDLGGALFQLKTRTSGWDQEQGVLQLEDCSLRITRYINRSTPGPDKSTDDLRTNLALRVGETTVVGSLGGDPVFITLRIELVP
ncbi:MAG: hypothetical protein WD226_05770 [Planctomycetota bacterium]